MSEKSDLRERARKAIDNLKGMSGSMARIEYESGKGPAKLIEDLLQALDTAEREERERCASIAEDHQCDNDCVEMADDGTLSMCHISIAAAIRREWGKG